MAGAILIRGGRVVDPAAGRDETADVLVEGGRVRAVGRGLGAPEGARVVEARGLVVIPGLVDLHVHLRTPGQEWKEDVRSGTRAAAAGGFTAVAAMPNTRPPVDSAALVASVRDRARSEGVVRVYPVGALSRGQEGQALAEIGAMAEAGAVAVSDDGRPVMNAELMRAALEYARAFGIPVAAHEEDLNLTAGGVMHRGTVSTLLGLRGIPAESEAVMVARDVLLAGLTGGHLHVCHVSARRSVEVIRWAKERGFPVTAEVTPHHLVLTDDAVRETRYDPDTKMNPPLRTAEDREALVEALADGTIDCIATDHAPHSRDEKEGEYDRAAFGVVGLETALGLVLTRLVAPGRLSLSQAVYRMSRRPAEVFGLPGGRIAPGDPADLALVDLEREWVVDPERFRSKGRNTPFRGWRLVGRVVMTLVEGRVVHEEIGDGTVREDGGRAG